MKLIRFLVLGLLVVSFMLPSQVMADEANPENPYFQTRSVTLADGTELEEMIINGPPTPPSDFLRPIVTLTDPHQNGNIHLITSVPAFNWSFGCSATSASMIAGYYDRNGYPNMYAGPTHGEVMPMDNSYWPDWYDGSAWRHQCPLSATHNGLDGRATNGNVDDYWISYNSPGPDPYYGNWTEHTAADCTADFMHTNKWHEHEDPSYTFNVDGATRFYNYTNGNVLNCSTLEGWGPPYSYDGTVGVMNFYESRGYTVSECFSQYVDTASSVPGQGFTFDDYKAEIDAGYPVMFHIEGHTMVGFGYDDSTSPGTIYLHDTWDYDSHTMLWGGDYPSGSEYDLVSVSIVHLALNGYNSAQTGGWDTGSTWVGGSVPGASDSATIQSGHTVTLTSNTQINHLAIEYDGTLVIPEGVTLNVEGAFSNNGKIQQTLTVPGGGSTTTEFLRITSTGGVDKYHGVDITPVTTAMGVTTVSIRGNHTGGCTTVMEDPLLYRCFDITPGSEVEATIKFWYDEDERNGQDADNLLLWHHEGGNTWSQELGTHTRSEPSDSDDYTKCLSGGGQECWLEVTEITDYSDFDIGSQAAGPTAVGVQSFASKVEPGFYVALIVGLSFVLLGAGGLIYQRKKI